MSSMAVYQPQCLLREVAVDPRQAAVLFIDVQNLNCHRGGAIYRNHTQEELEGPEFAYWWARIDDCMGKWQQLQQAARGVGIEVMYTVIQSLTRDGRDRSLDYKISGFHVPPGCWDANVVDALQPGPDEIVLPKTSSSVFNSTCIDYLLRNMDKRFLLLAGCVTDQCVAHAVKDAADLGYLVTLVTDCCATYSAERHLSACQSIAGYCRQRTLDVLLEEFVAVTGAKPALPAPLSGVTGGGTGGPPGDGGTGGGPGVTGNNAGVTSAGLSGGPGVTSGAGVTGGHGVTGGPGVTGVTGLAGVMHQLVTPAGDAGVTGSHQLGGGMGDTMSHPVGVGVPGGMMMGQVMPAAGVSAGLLDGSMNGSGGSYKRGLYAPGMVYGSGLSGAVPMDMETYNSDNFSPGLLPGEHSDGMEEEDDYEAGGARSRGRSRGRRRMAAAATAAAAVPGQLHLLSGGAVEKKQVYFEYAKLQWETDQEFLLPNGQSWVDIAVRGDPKGSERGLIFCKLCRHYSKQNVFGKGYRAGKRSALKEHMQTKDHKELVEALEAGVIPMPGAELAMPAEPTAAAAATAAAGDADANALSVPLRKRGRGRPTNAERAARLAWEQQERAVQQRMDFQMGRPQQQQQQHLGGMSTAGVAAAAGAGDGGGGAGGLELGFGQQQQYPEPQQQQQQQQGGSGGGYYQQQQQDGMYSEQQHYEQQQQQQQYGMQQQQQQAGSGPAGGSTRATPDPQGFGGSDFSKPYQQYSSQQQQQYNGGATPAHTASGTMYQPQQYGPGSSSGGLNLSSMHPQNPGTAAAAAAAAGGRPAGSNASGGSGSAAAAGGGQGGGYPDITAAVLQSLQQGQALVSAEETAQAITTAFSQAAAAAGVDPAKIAEALATAAAAHGNPALTAAATAAARGAVGASGSSSGMAPQQQQQQQQHGMSMQSGGGGGLGMSAAGLKAITDALNHVQQQGMLATQ